LCAWYSPLFVSVGVYFLFFRLDSFCCLRLLRTSAGLRAFGDIGWQILLTHLPPTAAAPANVVKVASVAAVFVGVIVYSLHCHYSVDRLIFVYSVFQLSHAGRSSFYSAAAVDANVSYLLCPIVVCPAFAV
jgi:hypothetical protein